MLQTLPLGERVYDCDLRHRYVELHFYLPTPKGWGLIPHPLREIVLQAITDTGYLNEGEGGQERVLTSYYHLLEYSALGDVLRDSSNYGWHTTKIIEELLTEAFRHVKKIVRDGGVHYIYLEFKPSVKTTFLYTGAILFDPTI